MGDDETRSDHDEPDGPLRLVACPTCQGEGRSFTRAWRYCAACLGSGLVDPEEADSILRSLEMEFAPPSDG